MKYFSILIALCAIVLLATGCKDDFEEKAFVGLYVIEDTQPSNIGNLTHIQGITFEVEDSVLVGKYVERSFYKKRFFKDVERDLRETSYRDDTLFFDMAHKDGAKPLYAVLSHKGDSITVGNLSNGAVTRLGRRDAGDRDVNYKLTFSNEPVQVIDTTYEKRYAFYKNIVINKETQDTCYEGLNENLYSLVWPDSCNYNLEPLYQEVERSMLADIAPTISTALDNFTRLSWHTNWTQTGNETGVQLYRRFNSDGYSHRVVGPQYCGCEPNGVRELHGHYVEKGGLITYIYNHDYVNIYDYSRTFRDKVVMYDCYLGKLVKFEDVFTPNAEAKLIPDLRNCKDAIDMLDYFYTGFTSSEAGDPYGDAMRQFNRRPRDRYYFGGNGYVSFVVHVAGEEKILNIPGSRLDNSLTDYGRALLNCNKIKEVYTLPPVPKNTTTQQRHVIYFLTNMHSTTGHYTILEDGWLGRHCAPACQERIMNAMKQEGGFGYAMGLIGGWNWSERDRIETELVSVTSVGNNNYDVKLKLTDRCRAELGMEHDGGYRTIRYNVKLLKGVPVICAFSWVTDFQGIPERNEDEEGLDGMEELPEGPVPVPESELGDAVFEPVVPVKRQRPRVVDSIMVIDRIPHSPASADSAQTR